MSDTTICENFGTVLACGNCEIQMYDKNLTQLPLSQVARLLIEVTELVMEPNSLGIVQLQDCVAYCKSKPINHYRGKYTSPDFEHHKDLIVERMNKWAAMAYHMIVGKPDAERRDDYYVSVFIYMDLAQSSNYNELLMHLKAAYSRSNKDVKTSRRDAIAEAEAAWLLEEHDKIIRRFQR